ncbi:unnamed protein product [Durusdinium trenchii]|uniref:Uncharacterized protein n=2 Tax=Durusdinium trenchii TaxID=1381693 RepID=A0ABP0NXQ3_9DINO
MAITSLRRIRAKTVRSAVASVALGERLPNAAYVATGALLLFSLSLILFPSQDSSASRELAGKATCKVCHGRALLGLRSFVLLLFTLSGVMPWLKNKIIPQIVDRKQFEASFNLDKYYGFAAQILYHFVLSGCFATAIYTSDNTLYHLATLAEPAYCTFDILLLLFTGVSFTHWQLKPLLVHHTISCACCHALMYGIPESMYGKLLQLVFHLSSGFCLGIANLLQTPSLKLSTLQRLWLQVVSMMFWAATRVGLVFLLGICTLMDAARIHPAQYRQVMVELNAAAIGSFAFVVIKTPIITRALQEAIQEYQQDRRDLEVGLNQSPRIWSRGAPSGDPMI